MENLKAVLEEAGSSFENVLKTTCYLSDMDNLLHLMKFIQNILVLRLHLLSTVAVKTLPKMF